MLKRFMTWLLNKLQKIAGAFGAKRDKGYKSASSARGLDTSERSSSMPDAESEGTEVAVAERVSYASPIADLPSDLSSGRPDTRSDASAAVARGADSFQDSAASAQVSKDSAANIDIRNRLDAASSSVSGIPEEKPRFPTEVSALLSSDGKGIDETIDLSVRPSEAISDDQLPAIQDLLPAIPSSPGIDNDTVDYDSAATRDSAAARDRDSAAAYRAAGQDGDSNDESAIDEEIAYESICEDELEDETLVPSDLEAQDTALPETDVTAIEADQPIVFTFDIIESEDDNFAREEADAAVETSAIAADSAPSVSSDRETEPSTEQISEPEREPAVIESAATLEDAQPPTSEPPTSELTTSEPPASEPPASDSAAEELVESSAPESADFVETLPYPWSTASLGSKANLANTDKPVADQPDSEILSEESSEKANTGKVDTGKADIELFPEDADKSSESSLFLAESNPSKTASEAPSIKQGTVKLLFTMKKGNFHGYIAPDDGSKDILFHQKYINADIFSQLERGAQVSATVKYIEGKAYATHVDLQK